MQFGLIKMVRFFVNLFFYGSLLLIPLYWLMVFGDYSTSDENHMIMTQVQHGKMLHAKNEYSWTEAREALAAGKPYVIEENSATLWVKADSAWEYLAFSKLGGQFDNELNLITFFFGLAILFFLKRIFDSMKKEGPFTPENAKRIQYMGWILIAKYIYLQLNSLWMSRILERYNLPYEWVHGHTPAGSGLHLGILLLCIGVIYQEGVKLKREVELVI